MSLEGKIYKNVLVEFRPLLQCLNVFILLKKTPLKIDVQLKPHSGEVIIDKSLVLLPLGDTEINAESMCNFQMSTQHISFRVATNNSSSFGSFKSEVIQLNQTLSAVNNNTFLRKIYYVVQCGNCSQEFTASTLFDRVLPLPSENSQPSDWFCHAHANTKKLNLDPDLNDIFYSYCYAHINSDLLQNIRREGINLSCRRCSHWLGIVFNSCTYKIWFNAVTFKSNTANWRSNPLTDCFLTLRMILKDCLFSSTKVVFSCRISNAVIHNLLLWVLDKSMKVCIDTSKYTASTMAAKVLFKFSKHETEEVKSWKSEINNSHVCISKGMMTKLLKHMYELNRFMPPDYSKANDFYMSYILMYDFDK